jgi:hypothetical protein
LYDILHTLAVLCYILQPSILVISFQTHVWVTFQNGGLVAACAIKRGALLVLGPCLGSTDGRMDGCYCDAACNGNVCGVLQFGGCL